MFDPQLTIPQWVSIRHPLRIKLIRIFNIPRSSGTHVEGNKVLTDGHTHEDLKQISIPRMQEILKTNEVDFYKLFSMILEKVETEEQVDQAKVLDQEVKRIEEDDMTRRLELEKVLDDAKQLINSAPKKRGRKPKV